MRDRDCEEVKMHVYDKYTNRFWDKTYSAMELKDLEDNNNPIMARIRPNLYNVQNINQIPTEKDRVIFVNAEKPYFRRYNVGIAERKKFSSVAESEYHKACKIGISQASKIKICIGRKFYILFNRYATCENIENIMGLYFETDCSIFIDEERSDPMLQELIGDELNLEIHHTCRISEKKVMVYTSCRKNLLEFDVPMNYLSGRLYNKTLEEKINIFKEFYEDTEKHYIKGVFYPPIDEVLEWDGCRTSFVDTEGERIEVVVFRDKYTKDKTAKDKIYKIYFRSERGILFFNTFEGEKMNDIYTAKRFANYIAYMHNSQKALLEFNPDRFNYEQL